MFYAAPPFWTGGRQPHVGQQVLIGHLERKTSPYWPNPRWLARDVASVQAIETHSRNRLSEPTLVMSRNVTDGLWARFLAFAGFRHRFNSKPV